MYGAFTLDIIARNPAFERDPNMELARILRTAAHSLERGTRGAPLHDSDGNRVGRFELEHADD